MTVCDLEGCNFCSLCRLIPITCPPRQSPPRGGTNDNLARYGTQVCFAIFHLWVWLARTWEQLSKMRYTNMANLTELGCIVCLCFDWSLSAELQTLAVYVYQWLPTDAWRALEVVLESLCNVNFTSHDDHKLPATPAPGRHARACTLHRLSKLALWWWLYDCLRHCLEFEVWQKYPVQLFANAAACIVMLQFCRCLQLSVLDAPLSHPLPPWLVFPVKLYNILHCLSHRS